MAFQDLVLTVSRWLYRLHYSLRTLLIRVLLVMSILLSSIVAAESDSDSREAIDYLIHPRFIAEVSSSVQGIASEFLCEEVIMPGRLFGKVSSGNKLWPCTESDKDTAMVAVVDVVDIMLDSRGGTYGVRLKLGSADLAIPDGQRYQVVFGTDIVAASPDDSEVTAEPAER